MGIYGHSNVNLVQLKNWAKQLDFEQIIESSQNTLYGKYASEETCRDLLTVFLHQIEELKDSNYWYKATSILNQSLIPAVFMVADNALRVANYFEIIIIAADIKTKKRMIKGFDYLDVGYLHVIKDKKTIATIGQKSDLMWLCLYELFIKHNLYSVEHTLPNHEEIMSLQLFDTWGLSDNEIHDIINNILFKCSTELNLNFKIHHLNQLITEEGISGYYELQTNMEQYDSVPIMYFNNAYSLDDIRMQYLNYYHVIEYYFIRAQNNKFIDTIKTGDYLTNPVNHNELHKILKKYSRSTKELESLKLVLQKAVDVESIKNLIRQTPERTSYFANTSNPKIALDSTASTNEFISKLANRIYYFRCSIAHAKGDIDDYIAIPEINDHQISKEILIIRYVAENVIKQCYNW